ncbi:DHA2 family efflux MFS transporter permease subunit [uncultured Acetobacteroides sp.]|uniref:DHA2 family efflux MFS transporter permease subunit n=1 Tax=uncultured Acetobacteroides sp. TaxID=1760811 RepID=UPI0029F4E2EE|nr:DHA2 family efflux MFS transporter permease subunit [uncultured Acetobacteroides sp.]
MHKSYKWWLLGNVMIGTFMAVLDATIVNVGLPKIMASFGVGLDKIEWVITAYMLAMAVMLPTAGWLADRFGYKRIYFVGLMLFTVGSLLCGMSGNENMLIISRIIQGFGAGAIQPVGMAIVTREFPPQQRGVALGFWAISAAASVSFGPLIGGYLVDTFSWPLIFDVNVPIGIIGLLATIVIQREYKNPRIKSFDFWGFITVSTFLPLVLYALTEGNAATNSAGWHAPYILVCFAISALAFVGFITAELTVKNPLIDLRLLTNHNFGLANLVTFIFSVGMFGSTFLLPLYLQNSLGYTAIQSGAVFLPVGIIQGMMSPLSGLMGDKINPKIPIATGIVLLATSFFLNSKLSYLTEHHYVMLSLYIRGFALGILFTPLSAISLSEIPREKMGQASSISNVIRQLAGSFGVAILATMLTTRVTYHTQMYAQSVDPQSPAYKTAVVKATTYIQTHAGSSPANAQVQAKTLVVQQLSKEAYIQGIDDDFLIAGVITLLGGIPLFWLHTKKRSSKNEKPAIHE